MNALLERLEAGIGYPGGADDVAAEVLANPDRLLLLAEGMCHPDEFIRSCTSRAMERIACADPELVRPLAPRIVEVAEHDPAPVVRWRYALILGTIPFTSGDVDADVAALRRMLHNRSVLVRRMALISLTEIARLHPERREGIAARIRPLADDPSAIVRSRARCSLDLFAAHFPQSP
jgi:vesicle coat complex subunit